MSDVMSEGSIDLPLSHHYRKEPEVVSSGESLSMTVSSATSTPIDLGVNCDRRTVDPEEIRRVRPRPQRLVVYERGQ